MGIFLVYILKSAVCLSLFYLFYRLLLSNETFHRFNRVVLLCILGLSVLLPLVEVSVERRTDVHRTVQSVEQLLTSPQSAECVATAAPVAEGDLPAGRTAAQAAYGVGTERGNTSAASLSLSWVQVVLLIYSAGVLFFFVVNLCSLWQLLRLVRSGSVERQADGTVLVVHPRKVAPFSWMNYIVVSRDDLGEGGREILIHEKAHIRKRHSWDLLLTDICVFFQWFNPAAWLLKQELRNIHEYEADESVIAAGVNARQYQLLLIKKAVGARLYAMANNFKHDKLKKRIRMMLKEKSNSWARLKCLFIVPLALVAVAAFARPEVVVKADELASATVDDLTSAVRLWTTGAEPSEMKIDTMHVSESWGTSIRVHNVGAENEPLLLVEGMEMEYLVLSRLQPEYVKSISMISGEQATAKYGEKAKHGVVTVELYTRDEVNAKDEYWRNKNKAALDYVRKNGGDSMRFVNQPSRIPELCFVNQKRAPLEMENALAPSAMNYVASSDMSGYVVKITLLSDNEIQKAHRQYDKLREGNAYDFVMGSYGDAVKGKNPTYELNHKSVSFEEFKRELEAVSAKSLLGSGYGATNGVYVLHANIKDENMKWIIVQGVVRDLRGTPIPDAFIRAKGWNSGTSSDENGNFRLSIPEDTKLIEVSANYTNKDKAVVEVQPEMEIVLKEKEEKIETRGGFWDLLF